MSPKNETPALLLAFFLTASLMGGGLWFLTQKSGINLGGLLSSTANTSTSTASTGATFAQVPAVPSGLFSYGGSTSWAPIRAQIDPAIQATFANFRLRYTDPINATPGSSIGIQMLLDGQIAFAQASRPIEDREYQQAQQRGFSLKQIPVALEGIAIATHPNLPVDGITIEQLRAIYTGKMTNWKQVGGPNLAITPYSRRVQDAGTVEFLINTILTGQPLSKRVQSVYSTTDALRKVSADPGGIYYASAPEIVPQCTVKPLAIARRPNDFVPPYQPPLVPPTTCPTQRNQLNLEAFSSGAYPLTRQLFVVIRQNGQIEQQAGEAYANLLLTDQGQKLITASGFVRIR